MKIELSSEKTFLPKNLYVHVIIPTSESAKNLERCLQSLQEQNYPIDEVIVVDGFSRDNTREVALKRGAKVILTSGTQATARNVGLANARGDFVLFLDSDQQLDAGVVGECVFTCLMYGAEAVKIPEKFVGLDFWGRCSALWKNRMVRAWGPKGGIPRFYRRSVLLESSAFSNRLRFWEDLELYQRLRLAGVKEAWCRGHVIHYENGSIRDVIQKYVSYGRSITTFRNNSTKAPYVSTIRLTLSTMVHTFRDPGRAFKVFLGCLFLAAVKSLSGALGFLSRLR